MQHYSVPVTIDSIRTPHRRSIADRRTPDQTRATLIRFNAAVAELRFASAAPVRAVLSALAHVKACLDKLAILVNGDTLPEVPGAPKNQVTVKAHHTIDVWARTQREEAKALSFHAQVSNVGHRAKRFLKAGVNPWSETGWTSDELAQVRAGGSY